MSLSEKGLKKVEKILGKQGLAVVENFSKVSPDFARYITDFAYGDIYSRKGMSDKDRELVGVASLITQGRIGLPLRAHLQGMFNVGWEKEDIIELIIFMIPYVGFPAAVDAMKTAQDLFDEMQRAQ